MSRSAGAIEADVIGAASVLEKARSSGVAIEPIASQFAISGADAAYAVQETNTVKSLSAGRRLAGRKIGLTSHAVQQQLGVDRPDFGMLFDDMRFFDGDELPFGRLIQPRAEAEIAFVLGSDLATPGSSLTDLQRAVEFVLPAIEIVDSAIADWRITFEDTVGSYNKLETEGFVNIPLNEQVAARVSFATKDRDGLFLNEFTGNREGRANNFAIRGQLSFKPSTDFEALLKVEAGRSNTDFKNGRHIGLYNPAAVGNPAELGLIINPADGQFFPGFSLFRAGVDFVGYRGSGQSLRGSSDYQQREEIDFVNSSLRLEWDLGSASLVSITGYERVDRVAEQDADYSPNHIFHNNWISKSDLFSQELRLTGDSGPLKYIVGGYYYQDKHDVNLPLDFFGCFTDPNPARRCTSIIPGLVLPRTIIDFKYTQKSTNFAGFGQLTYDLTERLSVTGGLRYTWEKRSLNAISRSSQPCVVPGFVFTPTNPNPGGGVPACALGGTFAPFVGSKSWNDVLGKVGVDFRATDNLFLYASFNQGFKAGNWNGGAYDQLAAIQDPVDPEKTDTFEVGLKSDLLDRKLRVNVSAFYTKVKDLQVFIFQNASTVLQNAATARIYGVEAEVVAVPTSGLRLSLSGGYLNAQYQNFVASVADPANPFGARVTRDLSGNTIVQSPKLSLSGAVEYTTKLSSDWEVQFGADANYRTRTFFTVFNDYLNQPGYALVNGRIRLGKTDDSLAITASVTNIFDKRYFNDAAQIGLPFGVDEVFEAYNPRSFQVSVTAKF